MYETVEQGSGVGCRPEEAKNSDACQSDGVWLPGSCQIDLCNKNYVDELTYRLNNPHIKK